MQFVRQP